MSDATLSQNQTIQKQTYERIAKTIPLSTKTFLDQPLLVNHLHRKSFLDKIVIKSNDKILEIGCQTSDHLLYLLHANPRLQPQNIYGIDLVKQNVEKSQVRIPQGHFFECCAEHLPFENETFDTVIFAGVIEHLDDPKAVCGEIARVLKKNGMVHIYGTVKDYHYTFQYFRMKLFPQSAYVDSVTTEIGHDYKNIIKPLVYYQKCLRESGLIEVESERSNQFFDAMFDSAFIWLIRAIGSMRRGFVTQGAPRECTTLMENASIPKANGRAIKLATVLVRGIFLLLVVERKLLKRIGGSWLANYQKA
jgi:ubiquinone/menaquinone biosynthesis C-methylase UbiE